MVGAGNFLRQSGAEIGGREGGHGLGGGRLPFQSHPMPGCEAPIQVLRSPQICTHRKAGADLRSA